MKTFKLTKVIVSTFVIVSALVLKPIGASAEWRQDNTGWWYAEGSSWAVDWKLINGKWYYFGQDGYMVHDTIINGYKIGSDGAWNESTKSLSSRSMIDARLSELNASNDDKIADTRFQKIIGALENRDKEGLKKMFSPQALKEAKGIDGDIDYIMDFYKGTMKSKDRGGPITSESIDYGVKKIEQECSYKVTTDVGNYSIYFIDKIVDTGNSDNVGLYTLDIIKESDGDKFFYWGSKTTHAGVCRSTTKENKR